MTDRELLESMSSQIGELVRHVAGVRQSNVNLEARFDRLEARFDSLEARFDSLEARFDCLEARFDSLEARIERLETRIETLETNVHAIHEDVSSIREDIRALDTKIDDKTDFLSSKIDHFIGHFSAEKTRDRNKFEEERHLRSAIQRKTEQRFDEIEQRLSRLEASRLSHETSHQ